jgi:hypothetical protein
MNLIFGYMVLLAVWDGCLMIKVNDQSVSISSESSQILIRIKLVNTCDRGLVLYNLNFGSLSDGSNETQLNVFPGNRLILQTVLGKEYFIPEYEIFLGETYGEISNSSSGDEILELHPLDSISLKVRFEFKNLTELPIGRYVAHIVYNQNKSVIKSLKETEHDEDLIFNGIAKSNNFFLTIEY